MSSDYRYLASIMPFICSIRFLQFDHPVINQNWKVSFSWFFESPSKISFPKSYNRVYTKDYSNTWENEYLTFPTRAQSLEHEPSHTLSLLWSPPEEQKNTCWSASLCNPPPQSPEQPVFHRLELRWDLSRCSWRHTCSHNPVISSQAHRRGTESKISCF